MTRKAWTFWPAAGISLAVLAVASVLWLGLANAAEQASSGPTKLDAQSGWMEAGLFLLFPAVLAGAFAAGWWLL